MRLLPSVRSLLIPTLMLSSMILMSARSADHRNNRKRVSNSSGSGKVAVANLSRSMHEQAMEVYESGDLQKYGLSRRAFEFAWKGYQYLLKKGKVQKRDVLSICDFSQSSRKKRLYVIDVNERKMLLNTYVAHGRKSGGEFASSFSNSPESHKSSLGFYVTRTTYFGEHGISLKIDGLEKGINDRAFARHIVIHGSDYVGDSFIENNPFSGRSFGCPAVPEEDIENLVTTIKDGSCLFIYHPSRLYLKKSKILG